MIKHKTSKRAPAFLAGVLLLAAAGCKKEPAPEPIPEPEVLMEPAAMEAAPAPEEGAAPASEQPTNEHPHN